MVVALYVVIVNTYIIVLKQRSHHFPTMNRSPYHLTGSSQRQPIKRIEHVRQRREDINLRSGTPPLDKENPHHDVPCSNPIFQPQLGGAARRYVSSRSMMAQHRYQNDIDIDFRESSKISWSQAHPLQYHAEFSVMRPSLQGQQKGARSQIVKPLGLLKILDASLRKIAFSVLAYLEESDEEPLFPNENTPWKIKKINRARLLRLLIPFVVLVLAMVTGILPTGFFGRSSSWDRLEVRQLNGRQCVMNLFVDKHDANEFNPDFDPSAGKDPLHKAKPMEGTYRTKGQVEVINRFISSVAAAFRPNVSLQQHIVFAGIRDGGHLAKEALRHWPPRGSYRTQLHIFADEASDELSYETIQQIEDRFKDDEDDVHIYDAHGNVAGHENADDDDNVDEHLKHHNDAAKAVVEVVYESLPELKRIVFETDEEDESIIPYLHVDGTSMATQMAILARAEQLLQDHKIVVVGLEHPPDLDVNDLIEFFRNLNYKTFMLGLRQLTRIDNLCPEILENVMDHPSLALSSRNSWGGLVGTGQHRNTLSMPPFFVAMPRGRHSKEEMAIQHMYDLFSGSSGVSQVKTANDRVANVK